MTEENKAIEMLKDRQKDLLEGSKKSFYSSDRELYKEHAEGIEVILNLIEKLKKENEDLNNRDTSRLSEIGELRTKNNYLENEIKYYYIPKDKIEKIKSKNIGQYMNFYREIEELLEEE